MYLKNDRITVTIKDLIFRSHPLGTSNEFILDPRALTGWDDGVNARRNATVRAVSDGDFTEPYRYSSRLIAISGTAVATNAAELHRMHDQFSGLLGSGEYTQIRVQTSATDRYATVGLENSISWEQHYDTVASFRLELYAPDPHLYGEARTITLGSTTAISGGLVYPLSYPLVYNTDASRTVYPVIANRGNAVAWPSFTIVGDYYSGFVLTDGRDRSVTYNGVVSSQSPVTIDMGRGTAIQGGVDKSVLLSTRQWFGILPGETLNPRFLPIQDASGWCDIIIRDTFI